MKVKDISNLRAGDSKVVIKLNKLNDSLKFGDGTELYLETKYEPADHTQVIGTVVAVPDKLTFTKEKGKFSMEHETTMDLLVGDTVYMEYFAVMMALADKYDVASAYPDPKWFEHDGSLYVVIRYEEIYFIYRDNEVIPINGYCIARPITVPERSEAIILLDEAKKRKSGKWAEIVIPGKPCTDFYDPIYSDGGEIKEGDCVLFYRFSNQRIEHSLHQTLFKGEGEHYVIQRKWMEAITDAEHKHLIEEGRIR